jgi:hypothetical protein
VKSDVVGAFVSVAGSVDDEGDDTGAISIGGALRGGAAANSGTIFAGDDIASVKIGQGIIGGAGPPSGSIESGGKIGKRRAGQLAPRRLRHVERQHHFRRHTWRIDHFRRP